MYSILGCSLAVWLLSTIGVLAQPPEDPQPYEQWKDPVSGLEFIWLQGGCFQLGSRDPRPTRLFLEKPLHTVCVDGFWMGKYEVTNGQYRQFKPAHNSQETEGRSLNGDEQPVVYVSWYDAKAYMDWLTRNRDRQGRPLFRLPTEAEWEFAVRAGTETPRYWGGEEESTTETCAYANVADFFYQLKRVSYHDCSDGFLVSAPVGRFPANPAGLYDMLGNVWEWCEDHYGKETYRVNQAADRPRNPLYQEKEDGFDYRVIRGGSWLSEPNSIRCAKRSPSPPASRFNVLGFRVVMETEQEAGLQNH